MRKRRVWLSRMLRRSGDVHGEGKPPLHANVAQAELFVLGLMVVVQTLAGFFAHLGKAVVALADAVGLARLDTRQNGKAAGVAAVALGQGQRRGFLVDVGTVQGLRWHALGMGPCFSFAA